MPNPIRDYFTLLGVGASEADPTVPFDNEFHLLGLDEGETDAEIAQKARPVADARSQRVDKIGQAHAGKRLDILLRDKINQAGARFDGQPASVRAHRDELYRLRDRRLKEFASALCDKGKWTLQQGSDILEPIAYKIGVPSDGVSRSVADALQSAGQWLPTPAGARNQPSVNAPQLLPDGIAIGPWRIPIWYAILLVGIVLEVIDRWAGLAYGLAFVLLAVGKGFAERQVDTGALRRNLLWGGINAGLAGALGVAGMIAMLTASGGQAARPLWAGEWDTDWGKMIISDGRGPVTATYESRTGSGRAELRQEKDKADQPVLNGKWCLGTSCDTATQKGLLLLVMGKDGRTFDGYFTYGLDGKVEAGDSAGNMIVGWRKSAVTPQ